MTVRAASRCADRCCRGLVVTSREDSGPHCQRYADCAPAAQGQGGSLEEAGQPQIWTKFLVPQRSKGSQRVTAQPFNIANVSLRQIAGGEWCEE